MAPWLKQKNTYWSRTLICDGEAIRTLACSLSHWSAVLGKLKLGKLYFNQWCTHNTETNDIITCYTVAMRWTRRIVTLLNKMINGICYASSWLVKISPRVTSLRFSGRKITYKLSIKGEVIDQSFPAKMPGLGPLVRNNIYIALSSPKFSWNKHWDILWKVQINFCSMHWLKWHMLCLCSFLNTLPFSIHV